MTESTPTESYPRMLESLPPEVRRHVLSMLQLPELKALVRASPTFHQQYLLDRKYLLCTSIENTLGSVIVDAYAVQLSASQPIYINEKLSEFIQSYSEQISQRLPFLPDTLAQNEAISMATLYLNSVEPITQDFARWALSNLPSNSGNGERDQQQKVKLSPSETMRFTRTVYRFQLISQLADPSDWNRRFFGERVLESIFNIIEPWEIEEFVCFWKYAQDIYVKIFEDIRWDLHPDNPRFDDQGRPPTPDGAFELDVEQDEFLEGTILRGVDLLKKILFGITSHEDLVLTMQQYMSRSFIPVSASYGMLGTTPQELRRGQRPTERDWMLERRVPISFSGDGEPDAPPLAWIIIWDGTYSNLYGDFTCDALKAWGYVFWDAATIDRLGARDLIERQWKEEWSDYDPRQDLLPIGRG